MDENLIYDELNDEEIIKLTNKDAVPMPMSEEEISKKGFVGKIKRECSEMTYDEIIQIY